jgi:hypothetical protein
MYHPISNLIFIAVIPCLQHKLPTNDIGPPVKLKTRFFEAACFYKTKSAAQRLTRPVSGFPQGPLRNVCPFFAPCQAAGRASAFTLF